MANYDVGIVLRAYDRATKVFDKIDRSFKVVEKSATNVNRKFQAITHEANMLNMKLGLMAAGGAWAFNSQFVNVASKFERYQTVLEQLEGTNAKAKKSMDWVMEFATKTPYELDNVFESFVKLRAYGLEPMNGLLRILGDTSAAMDKPILMAVEAIADAVTGENERLKEFGIKARAVGDKIVYEYSQNGQTLTREASKSNRAMIQSTLEAIFNQKYAGAMDKLSKTWSGMTSNLADYWTKFKKLVMDSGVFDLLEDRLRNTLDKLNAMAENGELEKLANQTGEKIISVINSLDKAFKQMTPVALKFLSIVDNSIQAIGGYGNALWGLIGLMAGKFAWSVGEAVFSVGKLFKSLKTLEIGYNLWYVKTLLMEGATNAFYNLWCAKTYLIENRLLILQLAQTKLRSIMLMSAMTLRGFVASIKATSLAYNIWYYKTLLLEKAQILSGRATLFMEATQIKLRTAMLRTSIMARAFWTAVTGPIGWAIAGIAAVAGAAYLIYKNWQPISDFFSNFWNKFKEGFSKAFDMFKKFAMFSPFGILAKAGSIFAKSSGTMPSFDVGSKYINQTGIAMVHEGEEIAPAGTVQSILGNKSGGSISVSYSPVISLSGLDTQAKEELTAILKKHKDEIIALVANAQRKERRLAF